MASPIIVVDRSDSRQDPRGPVIATFTVLFVYRLEPVVTNALGATWVPSPSSSLPFGAAALMSADELSRLDSGALGFEVRTYNLLQGQPVADLATKAAQDYPAAEAAAVAAWRLRAQRIGYRVAVAGESI